jgi:hypothetical protein
MSQIGARPLAPGEAGIAAGNGFPSLLWMQFTQGTVPGLDAGIRADLYGAAPLGTLDGGAAIGFGIPLRIDLGRSGNTSFALRLAPDLLAGDLADDFCSRERQVWRCRSGSGVGVGIEQGFLVGLMGDRASFVTGVAMPLHAAKIHGRDGIDVVVPLTVVGGIEVPIVGDVQALGLVQPGLSLHTMPDDSAVEGYVRFWTGIESAI